MTSAVLMKPYISLFRTSHSPFWQLEVRVPMEQQSCISPRAVRRTTKRADLSEARKQADILVSEIAEELEALGVDSDFLWDEPGGLYVIDDVEDDGTDDEADEFVSDLLEDATQFVNTVRESLGDADLVDEFRIRAEHAERQAASLNSTLRSVILFLRANRTQDALEVAELGFDEVRED